MLCTLADLRRRLAMLPVLRVFFSWPAAEAMRLALDFYGDLKRGRNRRNGASYTHDIPCIARLAGPPLAIH